VASVFHTVTGAYCHYIKKLFCGKWFSRICITASEKLQASILRSVVAPFGSA